MPVILLGHPSGGNPAYNVALAHFEAGRLEAFCIPWMPSETTVALLNHGPLRPLAQRLSRRLFHPLANAPKIQGRIGEMRRLAMRAAFGEDERLSYAANDWIMETMKRESSRPSVTALHSFEDCSQLQFEQAHRLGKACLYDMPIGYYPYWEQKQRDLAREYAAWIPAGGLPSTRHVRPAQKVREMEMADLVLIPCRFVETTIRAYHADKKVALAPYGVDLDFWRGPERAVRDGPLRFIYAGQLSLRKGIPLLLDAWSKANLTHCELELVGGWHLSEAARGRLPASVKVVPACSSEELRGRYGAADVFVFPSFFEGFGLVLSEALACGLPAIATEATAAPDLLDASCGEIVPSGNLDALVAALEGFAARRDELPAMSRAARRCAEKFTWQHYRDCVSRAVAPFA